MHGTCIGALYNTQEGERERESERERERGEKERTEMSHLLFISLFFLVSYTCCICYCIYLRFQQQNESNIQRTRIAE